MSRPKRTILLVEDETSIREPLAEVLRSEGFETLVAGTVAQALEQARREPDLVLLDVMLPDGSGFDVCRELRRDSQVPIIMLTARGEEADRVVGLELGADDYVVKPFSGREVVARIRAVLRRADAPEAVDDDRPLEVADLRLDPAKREVTLRGETLELSRKEFELLAAADAQCRLGRDARAADRRGLGPELVRLDEDARRPRQRHPAQARRRPERAALPAHGAGRRLPLLVARRGRMSLRLQLLAAFAYVLLLIIVALEVPLALNLARRIDAEVKNEAAGQAFVVAASASGRMKQPKQLAQVVRTAGNDLGGRVIVVDAPRGRLLADSTVGVTQPLPYATAARPELRTALRGVRAQGERHSDTLGQDLLYTAVPVTNNGQVVGAVRVTQDLAAVHHRVRRAVLALIAIGAFALVLGLTLAWFLAGSLSRPLRKLAATARRVEAGDLEARAEVTGATEQREVSAAFNDMAERLGTVLAAQREFVANASHQLRTPLTGLRLRLESARAKAGRDAQPELEAAELEVERLARLLTSLLTLAREGDKPSSARPVSLAHSAELAHERWAAAAEQDGRELELAGSGDATIMASEEDLAILLDNLIENALRYSPTRVTVDWGRNGDEAWLAVLDEGPGLAPGEETSLFDRFARGSAGSSRPGTGLGLAIVQTLAQRWRGSASLANRIEGGTRAEVRFPVAATVAEESWVEASS